MYESKNDFRSYLEEGLYLKHYGVLGMKWGQHLARHYDKKVIQADAYRAKYKGTYNRKEHKAALKNLKNKYRENIPKEKRAGKKMSELYKKQQKRYRNDDVATWKNYRNRNLAYAPVNAAIGLGYLNGLRKSSSGDPYNAALAATHLGVSGLNMGAGIAGKYALHDAARKDTKKRSSYYK